MNEIIAEVRAPIRRRKKQGPWTPRVTQDLREALNEPSETRSVVVDQPTKAALRSLATYHGWQLVTRKEDGGQFRVWRVA